MRIRQSITKPFHNTLTIFTTTLVIPSHEIGDLTDLLRSECSRLWIVRMRLHGAERHDESIEYFLRSIRHRSRLHTLRSLFDLISESYTGGSRSNRTSHTTKIYTNRGGYLYPPYYSIICIWFLQVFIPKSSLILGILSIACDLRGHDPRSGGCSPRSVRGRTAPHGSVSAGVTNPSPQIRLSHPRATRLSAP